MALNRSETELYVSTVGEFVGVSTPGFHRRTIATYMPSNINGLTVTADGKIVFIGDSTTALGVIDPVAATGHRLWERLRIDRPLVLGWVCRVRVVGAPARHPLRLTDRSPGARLVASADAAIGRVDRPWHWLGGEPEERAEPGKGRDEGQDHDLPGTRLLGGGRPYVSFDDAQRTAISQRVRHHKGPA